LNTTTTRRVTLVAPNGTRLNSPNAANVTLEVRALPAISGTRAPSPTPTSTSTPKPTPSPTPAPGGP
jgi:hypothetical protein